LSATYTQVSIVTSSSSDDSARSTLRWTRRYVGWQLSEEADVTQPAATLQAEAFGALEKSPVDLTSARILIVAANADFLAAVRQRSSQSEVEWVTTIDVIDVTSALSSDGARFVIDDHPTQLGHAAIAREIAATIVSTRHTLAPGPVDAI
jgi:hypothetical protein